MRQPHVCLYIIGLYEYEDPWGSLDSQKNTVEDDKNILIQVNNKQRADELTCRIASKE